MMTRLEVFKSSSWNPREIILAILWFMVSRLITVVLITMV